MAKQAISFDIRGARPAILSPLYGDDLKDVWDASVAIEHLVARPMFDPISPTQPVTFTCNGQVCGPEDVAGLIVKGAFGDFNSEINNALNMIYAKGLMAYGYSLTATADKVFLNQAAALNNMRVASETVKYTTLGDIIPAAKSVLAGGATGDAFFVSVGYTFSPETLGFWVRDASVFDDFMSFVAIEAARLDADLSTDAKVAISSLAGTRLDECVLGFLLRGSGNETEGDQEGTFARFIVEAAMEYSRMRPDAFGCMPFDIRQLVEPNSIVFANVDAHAHSFPEEIKSSWEDVNRAIASKPKVFSQSQIQNLTAAQAALRKAKKKLAKANDESNREDDASKREMRPFNRKWSSARDLLTKRMVKVIDKLGRVNRSENAYKFAKSTYMRPNRRDPENGDLQGKTISTKYKPDIHLYLDTSGSISEENYQAAVMACIRMARKLNVNLYFNSFSHVMSGCVKLNLKNKSVKQIYKQFQRVQKVGGGTDYRQIWDYICASKKRQKEFSLIITDFEWCVPRGSVHHPRNLYYFPIASHDSWEWRRLCESAKEFAQDMLHLDPKIRSKMLF